MFPSVYTTPGIGNILHTFLPIEDRLRMDCVSKEIRAFHRQEVYPRAKSLLVDLVMKDAETQRSGMSYLTKMSKYAETIVCVPNDHDLKLPRLVSMPKVKRIEYAVTMTVDVTQYDITHQTSDQWVSVEEVLHDLAEDYDNEYALRNIDIVPGNIRFIRTDPETGEETEAYVLEDQDEATHCAYYRRFGYDPIYIPWCIYRKDFRLFVPKYLAATVVQEQHGKKITYWDDGDSQTMGRVLLDFH